MNISEFKTIGVSFGFVIVTPDGESYRVHRSGNKFTCGDFTGTLKEIKTRIAVADNTLNYSEEDEVSSGTTNQPVHAELEFTAEQELRQITGVCPASMFLLAKVDRFDFSDFEIDMLDSYGLVRPDGTVNVEYAQKEFELNLRRFNSRKADMIVDEEE